MVERRLVIGDPKEQELLWGFYDCIFRTLNEETPIIQSFPKKYFMEWLGNPQVIKFIERHEEKIVGFCAFAYDIELEPLLSPTYFQKHFPNKRVIYCPVLALSPNYRRKDTALKFIKEIFKDGWSENGILVFLHSKAMAHGFPRLFKLASSNYLEGREIDAEACWIYAWKDGKKPLIS